MIGIFGIRNADSTAPASAVAMAASIAGRYTVDTTGEHGGAIGRVAHRNGDPRAGGVAKSADGSLICVAAGRIYEMEELAENGEFIPDAAALLLRLAERGALDRLAEVNGQYCAALYDGRAHRLTLITDRLASFPIHYWSKNGETVFATNMHTLLDDRRVPRRVDPLGLAQLFTMQRTVGTCTNIADVHAVPGACVFEIDADGARERRYWNLEWRAGGFDVAEGARRLTNALAAATARQAAGQTCGLLLSGGVDSRMVLAALKDTSPDCWTTASYEGNPELALACRIANLFGARHHALIVPPAATLEVLEDTVVESGGMYPASTPMSAFLPEVGGHCQTILTGHGIDYTLRGYYLPARFLELGHSRTRLPLLRPIPRRPTGRYVFENLRQGPPRATVDRVVLANRRDDWWEGQAEAMECALAPWLDSSTPVNAWDAFLLHAVSKHYAFTGMMATRAVADLAIPAFDNEMLDIYLAMPPQWRCNGRMVQLALRHLSTEAAHIANANTHFRADLRPWFEVMGLLGRGTLRRIGLASRPATPTDLHSSGSWQNINALYREDSGHRRRFLDIRDRLDALTLGVLDAEGLAGCIDEHLDGQANHGKLLRQLLTHDAWVRQFGIVEYG